jgi:hypothetical protein
VTVPNDKIIFITKPHGELAKEYTSMVTGIEIPSAGDIAGTINSKLLTED